MALWNCIVTNIGCFGRRFEPYEDTLANAFSTAASWVFTPGTAHAAGIAPSVEVRCLTTGTLYRIKPRRRLPALSQAVGG